MSAAIGYVLVAIGSALAALLGLAWARKKTGTDAKAAAGLADSVKRAEKERLEDVQKDLEAEVAEIDQNAEKEAQKHAADPLVDDLRRRAGR